LLRLFSDCFYFFRDFKTTVFTKPVILLNFIAAIWTMVYYFRELPRDLRTTNTTIFVPFF